MESPATSVPRTAPTGECRRRPPATRTSHTHTRRSLPALATMLADDGSAAKPMTFPRCPSPGDRLPMVYAKRKSPLQWAKSNALTTLSSPATNNLVRSRVKVMAPNPPPSASAFETSLGNASSDMSQTAMAPLRSTNASKSSWLSGYQRKFVTASISGSVQLSMAKPVRAANPGIPAVSAHAFFKPDLFNCAREPVWKMRMQPSTNPPAKRVPHGEKRSDKHAGGVLMSGE
mmetsp:Transcript_102151/g.294138  ORF Transcript_102151/g.294138 Transcript_102151/m.294138 type:complete len:231 (+) Transcript_102151:294-986(+)